MNVNRRLFGRSSAAALTFCGLAFVGSAGCSDNPTGNPPRESISVPRNRDDGGMVAPDVKGGRAPAKKTTSP